MSQIINLDDSNTPKPYVNVVTEEAITDSPLIGSIALVSRVPDGFREYLNLNSGKPFTVKEVRGEPALVLWGEYSRSGRSDEWKGSTLAHTGYGRKTIGNLAISPGTVADALFRSDLPSKAENAMNVASTIAGALESEVSATPSERRAQKAAAGYQRGDIKRNMWKRIRHALHIGNRFYLVVTQDRSELYGTKTKRVLGELRAGTHTLGELAKLL